MFGKLNKIFLGAMLIGIISGSCSAVDNPIKGQLQIGSSMLTYTVQLEKPSSVAVRLLKIFCNISKTDKPQEISCTISDRPWMSNLKLRDKFLETVIQKISEPGILLELPSLLEQLSTQMDEFAKKDNEHHQVGEDKVKQIEISKTTDLPSQSYLSTLDRSSSQNSLIRVLSNNIINLVKNPSDRDLRRRITNCITEMLNDPEPDREWILLQLNGLQSHEVTEKFYQDLKTLIEG